MYSWGGGGWGWGGATWWQWRGVGEPKLAGQIPAATSSSASSQINAAGAAAAVGKPLKKKKEPMSVGESFKFLAASPYIRDLAFLVVAYGISINLVEVSPGWEGGECGAGRDVSLRFW